MVEVSWSVLKTFSETKNLSIQYFEHQEHYYLRAFDGPYCLYTKIYKNGNEDQVDFETNFMSWGNKRVQASDSDAAQITQPKLATEGRSYQSCFYHFTSAKLGSAKLKNKDGSDSGMLTYRMFDANGTETQVEADAVCTEIDFNSGKDYEIRAGSIYQAEHPTEDVYFWSISAPNVPVEYGGQKESIKSLNMRLASFGNKDTDFDGGTTTKVLYDTTYYSHVIRIVLRHPAGFQHEMMVEVIWYV